MEKKGISIRAVFKKVVRQRAKRMRLMQVWHSIPVTHWPCSLVCLFLLQVLRNSHQIEWERKLAVLNSQPALQDWARTEIRNTIAHTKIREFSPNTVRTVT